MASRGSNSNRGPSSGRRDTRSTPRRGSTPTKATKVTAATAGSGTKVTARAAILLVVAVMLIASYTASLHAWWQQRAEIVALEAKNRATKAQIADLEDQQKRWDDPAYVRQQARERFGWVMPGEVGYRVIGADGEIKGDVSQLEEPTTKVQGPWVERLWGSVVEAGRDQAAEQESAE